MTQGLRFVVREVHLRIKRILQILQMKKIATLVSYGFIVVVQ